MTIILGNTPNCHAALRSGFATKHELPVVKLSDVVAVKLSAVPVYFLLSTLYYLAQRAVSPEFQALKG